jgi:hypothetical protein
MAREDSETEEDDTEADRHGREDGRADENNVDTSI